MNHILYYIHDPMCSWCYAFGPVWTKLQTALPVSVKVERLLGGLAPDNHSPMDEAMRQRLEATWQRIEQSVPGTRFNFGFWQHCTPYRSTYPSCRAVIAASALDPEGDEVMTKAIQRAYYQQARNPSEEQTLIEIATETGLDREVFSKAVASEKTEAELQRQITLAAEIGADSFPALVLSVDGSRWPVAIDYNNPEPMLDTIEFLLEG
ncbi:MAG: DsbA family protein [Pseudomonadota bacterium]